jgi:hypothetical protein
MLLAVDLNFIFFSVYLDDIIGQLFALLILTVAAAESAIGLAILVSYFRVRGSISVDSICLLSKANNCPIISSKYTEKKIKFKSTASNINSIDINIIMTFCLFKIIPHKPKI